MGDLLDVRAESARLTRHVPMQYQTNSRRADGPRTPMSLQSMLARLPARLCSPTSLSTPSRSPSLSPMGRRSLVWLSNCSHARAMVVHIISCSNAVSTARTSHPASSCPPPQCRSDPGEAVKATTSHLSPRRPSNQVSAASPAFTGGEGAAACVASVDGAQETSAVVGEGEELHQRVVVLRVHGPRVEHHECV